MRPTPFTGVLAAVLSMLPASPAAAQTIAAPTPLAADGAGAVAPPGTTFAAPASPYSGAGASYAPSSPYILPNAPTATLEGTITGPPPGWDPYGTPGAQLPPAYSDAPLFGDFSQQGLPTAGRRLLDHWSFEFLWMPGNAGRELGINNVELSATMAFPFFWNAQNPLLVTPGFGIWYWNGPLSPHDMPARTYDAYLDLAWNPQVTQWLGGELDFRIGVYSDFDKVTIDALRYQAKGLAVITLNQAFQFKFGAWYLDRNRVKILPAGGVVWTPNSDVRFEILFPNPKLAQRLTTWGTTEWWWYVRGEYGGGAWEVKRDTHPGIIGGGGFVDHVDYNDLQVALGVEFKALSGLTGHIEAGIAFDRELFYTSRNPDSFFRPNTAFLLRAGISY